MTIERIIEALGGGTELASELGCGPSAISNWIQRQEIPRGRWPDLVELAERKKVAGVTLATLRAAHAQRAAA